VFLQPWMQNRVEQWRAQCLSKGRNAVIFAEGDSWFDYPFIEDRFPFPSPSNYDLLANLAQDFVITSTARHGDQISQMVGDDEMDFNKTTAKRVKSLRGRFSAVLLSGGGNDIVGDNGSHFVEILRKGRYPSPRDYIRFEDSGGSPGFTTRLKNIMDGYRKFLHFVAQSIGDIPVITHTYDYPYPNGRAYKIGGVIDACGPWFKNRFDEQETPTDVRKGIITELINEFAQELFTLAEQVPNLHVVDLRGKVQDENLWQNEMHPTSEGFKILATELRKAISEILNSQTH